MAAETIGNTFTTCGGRGCADRQQGVRRQPREKTTPAIARSVKVRRLLAKGKGAHGREQCACAQLQQAQCTCKLRGVERGGEDGGGQAGAAAFGARTGTRRSVTS
ncbi:hypothetical protein AB1Y20_021668 [Prymnesium parvum]|uniref:Uncharacterized protein n=1 Tax=Prymnesium parvum TaxID=97485 RepID=A0AB34JM96_PRYPA